MPSAEVLAKGKALVFFLLYCRARLTSFQAILCTAFPQAAGYGSWCVIPSHLMATLVMVKAKGVSSPLLSLPHHAGLS
jgi:hypothetical protein